MYRILLSFAVIVNVCCNANNIFHEESRITFRPDVQSTYFGYSLLLTESGLTVGAPKAMSREKPGVMSGVVYSCPVNNLAYINVTCTPLKLYNEAYLTYKRMKERDFFRNDMWFGATIADVPKGRLLICAPRLAEPYEDSHLLQYGAIYIHNNRRDMTMVPLEDQDRQAFSIPQRKVRPEYGNVHHYINFYVYGQAGMAVKVVSNDTIIIGAPGILEWTGGIIRYKYNPDEYSYYFSRQIITNPYYTDDLSINNYFGYSVESLDVNGETLLVGGAPRSGQGYGQVLIFKSGSREEDKLDIRAKMKGPHLGSYFGASLATIDVNGDGAIDVLVGAPNFVDSKNTLPYDQGAVFVYLTRVQKDKTLLLEKANRVVGSKSSGARFGTTMGDLGDVDGDGFNDVAIGAPWENNGMGVIYIYRGCANGVEEKYAQRIIAEDGRGFGMSISKGIDVNNDNCNDLAVGAINSETVYLYRCVRTLKIKAAIKVPDALNLPENATVFTALFCTSVDPQPLWPNMKINLLAKITVDGKHKRANIVSDSEYNITVQAGTEQCEEQFIEAHPAADLTEPISLVFDLEPTYNEHTTEFLPEAVRLSQESNLHASFLIKLLRDCGEDMICTPFIIMTMEPFDNPYIPGISTKLGARLYILNKEEPAYGARVNITLSAPPKRVPTECSFQNHTMVCKIPSPLLRNAEFYFDIELENQLIDHREKVFYIRAELEDSLYDRKNITHTPIIEKNISVVPRANITINGKALTNDTIPVSRDKRNDNVTIVHYYQIHNSGPSDWLNLKARIFLPKYVHIMTLIKGCEESRFGIECDWDIPANVTLPVSLPLCIILNKYDVFSTENKTLNITTSVQLLEEELTVEVMTTLVLDPAPPIWPIILGTIGGLIIFTTIVVLLKLIGFFSRELREDMKKLLEENEPIPMSSQEVPSLQSETKESTRELLTDSD